MTRIVYKYSYRPTAEYVNNVTEKNTTTQTVHKTRKGKGRKRREGERRWEGICRTNVKLLPIIIMQRLTRHVSVIRMANRASK